MKNDFIRKSFFDVYIVKHFTIRYLTQLIERISFWFD